MTAPAEETLSLLRQVLELPGASLRVYHVAGSLSGENWQCGITWDTGRGINTGFHVACRHDPVAALADGCRHVLWNKITQKEKYPLAVSATAGIMAFNDDLTVEDLLG